MIPRRNWRVSNRSCHLDAGDALLGNRDADFLLLLFGREIAEGTLLDFLLDLLSLSSLHAVDGDWLLNLLLGHVTGRTGVNLAYGKARLLRVLRVGDSQLLHDQFSSMSVLLGLGGGGLSLLLLASLVSQPLRGHDGCLEVNLRDAKVRRLEVI